MTTSNRPGNYCLYHRIGEKSNEIWRRCIRAKNKEGLTGAELDKKYAEARRATITLRGEHYSQ